MKLFEDKQRTDNSYANHFYNKYDFYDSRSLPFAIQIRKVLNQWFAKYPKSEKRDLKKRFMKEFYSAFFELFIHELFLRQGFLLEVHPNVPGSNKKPDFLVKGNEMEFYLEAKVATDKTNSERSIENRIKQLYDSLNTIESLNFYICIRELELKSENQPSAKKIKRYLESEFNKYDPDEVDNKIKIHGPDSLDTITYEDQNIKLSATFIPRSKQLRGKKDVKSIGMYPFQTFKESVENSIKTAVEKKATRYGELDKPYLICINSISEKGLGYEDIMNSFFGSLQVTYSSNPKNNDLHYTRALDGMFLNSYGQMYTRVSAVLITHVYPSTLHVANHWLVKHPFAAKELIFDPFQLQKVEVIDDNIETIKGRTIKEILELSDEWTSSV
jgi:hypothetical protein